MAGLLKVSCDTGSTGVIWPSSFSVTASGSADVMEGALVVLQGTGASGNFSASGEDANSCFGSGLSDPAPVDADADFACPKPRVDDCRRRKVLGADLTRDKPRDTAAPSRFVCGGIGASPDLGFWNDGVRLGTAAVER